MNKYIKLIGIFIGIWFIASLISGGLSIAAFGFLEKNADMAVAVALPLSFVFSVPFVALTWLISIIARANGSKGEKLYKIVLHTSFFISLAGAIAFKILINGDAGELNATSLAISIGIVVSAVSTVIIFRNKLRSIE